VWGQAPEPEREREREREREIRRIRLGEGHWDILPEEAVFCNFLGCISPFSAVSGKFFEIWDIQKYQAAKAVSLS
jgi:hypothetical protein